MPVSRDRAHQSRTTCSSNSFDLPHSGWLGLVPVLAITCSRVNLCIAESVSKQITSNGNVPCARRLFSCVLTCSKSLHEIFGTFPVRGSLRGQTITSRRSARTSEPPSKSRINDFGVAQKVVLPAPG